MSARFLYFLLVSPSTEYVASEPARLAFDVRRAGSGEMFGSRGETLLIRTHVSFIPVTCPAVS